MKITIISGSHREQSESDRVAHYIRATLEARNVSAEVLSLARNPLPLWDEGVLGNDPKWETLWTPIAKKLQDSAAFVIVTPEWAGMVPPGLKNLLLLCSPTEVGHKPALIVSVSAGIGGSYPVAELRVSSYKNNRLVYLPEHVIVRDVKKLLNGDVASGARDEEARARISYSLNLLEEYARALVAVRESGVINHADFPYGV
jgi:NAD(P)H-dependent FMN reductase